MFGDGWRAFNGINSVQKTSYYRFFVYKGWPFLSGVYINVDPFWSRKDPFWTSFYLHSRATRIDHNIASYLWGSTLMSLSGYAKHVVVYFFKEMLCELTSKFRRSAPNFKKINFFNFCPSKYGEILFYRSKSNLYPLEFFDQPLLIL